MGGVEQGVVEVVVFVGELKGRRIKDDAFLHAVALGKAPGGDVADDDLQGDDLDLLHHGLPVIELLHKVGGDAGGGQLAHEEVAHAVVHRPLAPDGALLGAVKGGGVVLVGDDDQVGVGGGVDLLGLALVELSGLFHGVILL